MSPSQGFFESDKDYQQRVAKEADEQSIKDATGSAPSQGWFESDDSYRERIANEANSHTIKDATGSAPSQGWFEGDDNYRDRIAREANESRVKSSTGSSPSQGWFESDDAYDIRVRKEANEQILKSSTGSSPSQGFFEGDHEYRSRIAHEAREVRAEERQDGPSSSGYDSYTGSDSTSFSAGGFIKFIFGALGLVIILSMCTSMCSNKPTAPVQQQASQNSYQPARKAKKARKQQAINPPMQEEAPRQEAVQPATENVEPARTVREFRVPMNPSIAVANEFTAEVRFQDGRTESATIVGLSKGNNTLYVTLGQDYPEGTVVTIYPKIEYFNRFVVPGNPGILTSPSVSVTVQLPDGRSFQPCVQNIERGMTQLVVTTCDNYPAGTRVIVNPVYGGYRRY